VLRRTSATPRATAGNADRRLAALTVVILLLAHFLFLAPTAHAAPLVPEQGRPTSLAGHFDNLIDKSGALTLADILSGPTAQRFEKLPGFVNRGYMSGASWTRFTYATPLGGPAEWYLRLVPAFLDDVRVYVQEGPDPAGPASYREY
jgi:hypothetical protein